MPTYDYECTVCKARFEVRRSFRDTSPVACPQGHQEVRIVIRTVPTFIRSGGSEAEQRPWHQKPGMDSAMADAKSDLDKALGAS